VQTGVQLLSGFLLTLPFTTKFGDVDVWQQRLYLALVLVAGLAIVWMGAGSASIFACAMSIIQRDAPDGERGRILSIAQCGMGLSYGLGMLCISALGDWQSLRVAFLAAAVFTIGAIAVMTRRAPGWRGVIEDDGYVTNPAIALAGGPRVSATSID